MKEKLMCLSPASELLAPDADISHLNLHPTDLLDTLDEVADYLISTGNWDTTNWTIPSNPMTIEEQSAHDNSCKEFDEYFGLNQHKLH